MGNRNQAGAEDQSIAWTEAEEDRRPVLLPVAGQLFLGNATAAADTGLLMAYGITQTLNLAVNIDPPALRLPDGTVMRHGKVGLIDGPGNTARHLSAAVLAIAGMLAQTAPGKPSYPDHRPGGLLVHCRGGRSRSVVALAVYLAWTDRASFPTLVAALEHLRTLRSLPADQPHIAMCRLADEVVDMLQQLPAEPDVRRAGSISDR
jgi:hypothetical protein